MDQQIDIGLTRSFHLTESQSLSLQVQAFNVLNHANYYVQNGNGVNAIQYLPFGDIAEIRQSANQSDLLPRSEQRY